MVALPDWLHELATLVTLASASAWLVFGWLRVGRPQAGGVGGCSSCASGLAPAPAPAPAPAGAIRSPKLRVLG